MKYKITIVLFTLLLSSCIFVPKQMEAPTTYDSCQLRMPEWKLQLEPFSEGNTMCSNPSGEGAAEACLIGLGVVIPVGSLVVSGSIVLTGNTLRWLEFQGKCDSSEINKGLAILKQQLDEHIIK